MTRPIFSSISVVAIAIILTGADTPATLRQAAARINLLIGTAVQPSLLPQPAYSETLAREYNMVEPEDVMKWRAIRPSQNTFDFHDGDEVVRYAQAHGM